MGNRTYMEKTLNGTVVEWHRYEYNESNQLISEKLYNGKKTTSLAYTYDADGNRISETGRIGTDKVNRTYEYSVENHTDPSGNSFENASDKILAGYRKIDSLGHELIIAVNSFSSGVSGSISKSNMDKMAGVIAVGEMLERMFGIRVRSGKPAYEQYTDLTETLVQKLSKDATNRTMYYAGRCAGDALVMATGAMEIAEGLNSFFPESEERWLLMHREWLVLRLGQQLQ